MITNSQRAFTIVNRLRKMGIEGLTVVHESMIMQMLDDVEAPNVVVHAEDFRNIYVPRDIGVTFGSLCTCQEELIAFGPHHSTHCPICLPAHPIEGQE